MYDCESCDRDPCEGHIKEFCKFHPDNRQTNFGPMAMHWWRKKKWKMVVTTGMVGDLLHRNKVDIEFLTRDIKTYSIRIDDRAGRIEKLLKARADLLKVLEEVKQGEECEEHID